MDVDHGIPGVGRLGESVEDHERARVAGLAAAGPQPPVPVREVSGTLSAVEVRAAKSVMREIVHGLHGEISHLASAVRANNDLLRTIDVPMEQVADSHERATHSFETLRADITRVDDRLAKVEALCKEILGHLRGRPVHTTRVGYDEHGAAFPGE